MAQTQQHRSLKESVVNSIRRDIVLRTLRPGEIIRDGELTLRYGVSSSPIREALGQLEAERLIDISPNRAKRVGPLDRKTTADFFAVYKLVALAGFSWGAPHVQPPHLARMADALDAMSRIFADHDRYDIVLLAHRFFLPVYEASGNSEIIHILTRRLAWIDRLLVMIGKYEQAEILARLSDIMTHLERGDAPGAVSVHQKLVHDLERDIDEIDFDQFA